MQTLMNYNRLKVLVILYLYHNYNLEYIHFTAHYALFVTLIFHCPKI